MNIIVYIIITTSVFYLYSKNEKKKITEKYVNDILSLLYDTDQDSYDQFLTRLRERSTDSNDDITFMRKNITFLLGLFFISLLTIFYLTHLKDISITSLGRNAYYLIILGLTEIFLALFIIMRMPLPDVLNLMDAFIRKREECSKENIRKMITTENENRLDLKNCNKFNSSGDSCIVEEQSNTHLFTCNTNDRINRKRASTTTFR